MKKLLYIYLLLSVGLSFSQDKDHQRILNIKNQLDILATDTPGLTENVKTEISVKNITLANFLLAISDVHKVNINVSLELSNTSIANNFTNVTVADLLVFLCKEYSLTIDFTGNILSVKPFIKKEAPPENPIIPISYDPSNNSISIDAKGHKLYDVFKQIMDESGKNLVFSPGLENKLVTIYIQKTPFDSAMDNLAYANNLFVEQSKEGFYIFEGNNLSANNADSNNNVSNQPVQRPVRRRSSNFFFKVKDAQQQLLEVDFENTPIADIINDIGNELHIDIFTATPLDQAGTATFKASSITFDSLLTKVFEKQPVTTITQTGNRSSNSNTPNNVNSGGSKARFTFKKEGTIYFFGTENQLSVREIAIIHLQHRSVELLSDPSGSQNNRSVGRSRFNQNFNRGFNQTTGGLNTNFNTGNRSINNQTNGNFNSSLNRNSLNTNRGGSFNSYASQAEALVNILPDEVKQDLDIKVDYELNSFYVNGSSANVKRFKSFVEKIDKPVPVVLIEVMILEINKTSTIATGVSWGIGDEPTTTKGDLFPETKFSLGANTINKVIGGFDGFGSLNIGKVVPNFYATIEAMEENGDLKIRSTPKLSTLNGHRATFSNGQTSYYTITDQSIIGSDNPVTQTAVNYVPIDAELGLTIKPLVSGDGQVTLDIFVVQSSFGNRISNEAPPDINSREFSSIIRVRDQDIVILGGLEERSRNNSGTGIPLLSRIPIIKWLFSKRKREAKRAKLTVLIKPTIIN